MGTGRSPGPRKKRRVAVRIDMTPMVDIAFLLLIFYMATTQFKPPQARAVELPQSHSIIELPDKDIVTITVTEAESVYVDYMVVREVTRDGLESQQTVRRILRPEKTGVGRAVRQALNERAIVSKRVPMVIVKADRKARFELIDEVIRSMQEESVNRFLIITEKAQEEGA